MSKNSGQQIFTQGRYDISKYDLRNLSNSSRSCNGRVSGGTRIGLATSAQGQVSVFERLGHGPTDDQRE